MKTKDRQNSPEQKALYLQRRKNEMNITIGITSQPGTQLVNVGAVHAHGLGYDYTV